MVCFCIAVYCFFLFYVQINALLLFTWFTPLLLELMFLQATHEAYQVLRHSSQIDMAWVSNFQNEMASPNMVP